MLSRTAENIFWMSRYIERAENTARTLDVAYRMSLLPQGSRDLTEWYAPLNITGTADGYWQNHDLVTPDLVIYFLALDPNNSSSIYSSLRFAREAARAVRNDITTEMWEDLNATWLEMKHLTAGHLQSKGVSPFFDWVKERSHLFRGVTYGTILRDDAFHFTRLGTFLERADNTARLLDVKYHVLLPSLEDVGGSADYYQWGALLRSVSAFSSYRKIYRDVITPRRVAELLILRCDMPRSLHACLDEIDNLVPKISGSAGLEVERMAGELHARLHYGKADTIFEVGLHEYLTEFLTSIDDLAGEIRHSYF